MTIEAIFDNLSNMIIGPVADRLGKGLQNLLKRFDSAPDLKKIKRPGGGIGRHKGLKIPR